MNKLYINGHFLHQRLTGVQRYAREILAGFDEGGYPYQVLSPPPPMASHKLGQHMWEQLLLPLKRRDNAVFWSPTNTGPVYMDNHAITLHDAAVLCTPNGFPMPMSVGGKCCCPGSLAGPERSSPCRNIPVR